MVTQQNLDKIANKISKEIDDFILSELIRYGTYMVNEVLPAQKQFKNLTGNTITSYGYGVYYRGEVKRIGFNSRLKPAIDDKLTKGQSVSNYVDYDSNLRTYFKANVKTDRGRGDKTSREFLRNFKTRHKFSIVFCTGTEYSQYLENIVHLNVLSEALESSKDDFLNSFKQMK